MLSYALLAVVAASPQPSDLTGAWTTKVQFKTGAFAAVKDLEFLLVFNKGGTMTESSNYDSAPPVPPAYGIWKKIAKNQYQAKYVFYMTKPPTKYEDISTGGGWLPAGKGILLEKIALAPGGQTYRSTLTMKMFDEKGKPGETWTANCTGVRMRF